MKNVLAKIKVFVKYAAYVVLLMETINFFIKGAENMDVPEKTEPNV